MGHADLTVAYGGFELMDLCRYSVDVPDCPDTPPFKYLHIWNKNHIPPFVCSATVKAVLFFSLYKAAQPVCQLPFAPR